ncbi:hypothetical protein SLS58_010785 [Diplodia intermedia]|uniref:Cytochrome p450 protein n=1 Tax=Diplodia intermedia TaxID=856260 RepID=A0ABR3T4K4_9PEZI
MDVHHEIYTGVWTDWSHDKLLGATLTTTRTHGSLLIAFISLFVAVVGTSFWRICCFILHYIYSTEASRDAMYHQRQAVLRDAANATTGIASLFLILNSWRKNQPPRRAYQRILPLLAFSCLSLAAFAVASTFSSRISTTTGNAVLLASSNCGIIYPTTNVSDLADFATVFQPYLSQRFTSSADYAQQCYPNLQSEDCSTFVQRRLRTDSIRNATRPFPGNVCKSQDANLLLDTGLVDSHHDLGMNAPSSHRCQFRFVLQSAPLTTNGYTHVVPNLGAGLHSPFVRYQYGPRLQAGRPHADYTYQHIVTQKDQFSQENFTSARPTMDIDVYGAQYANGSLISELSVFAPVHELERTDADIYIAFLSLNTLLFPGQSDDLWYPAHDFAGNMSNEMTNPGESMAMYWSDEPASPMGLVLQYQLCKPGLPVEKRCTPLSSFVDAYDAATKLWQGSESSGAFDWFMAILQGPQDPLIGPIKVLGQAALDSKARMAQGFIGPLAANQWQLDVEKWTNITLSSIQQSFVEAATGPPDPKQNEYLIKPEESSQKQMCRNQKILSTAYTNFSVFGLATILIIGGVIILLSYTIEPLIRWIQRRRNLDTYARVEWNMNETLQLQRLAHEELGVGAWRRCDTDIPVTERFDRLAVLDLSDRSHPRLKAPPAPLEDLFNEECKGGKRREITKHPVTP